MREQMKHIVESLTGIGKPDLDQIVVRARKAHMHRFRDDGKTPNNPRFPFVHYKTAVFLDPRYDPASIFEVLFATNGWEDSWRDGIYPFVHFHTHTHEVLGIARGTARVQFGGAKGVVKELKAGDVVINAAGTGHRRLSPSQDLLVVGAYPQKRGGGDYDEPKPDEVDIEAARKAIARVGMPARDPVYGRLGGIKTVWK